MFKGPEKIVRDNKSSSYPVFELTGVNCRYKHTNYLSSPDENNILHNIHKDLVIVPKDKATANVILIYVTTTGFESTTT